MKPTVATFSLGGCTGCHLALLDGHERLLELLGAVDLVESPLTDGGEVPRCDVALVEGAIATERDERKIREIRERAATVVAMGSCAVLGGIGGLRNLRSAGEVVRAVFGSMPDAEALPALAERVRPLSDLVDVDAEIPGCSPPTDLLLAALEAVLEGRPSAVRRRNLCADCHREHTTMLEHSRDFVSDAVYALMELDDIDPTRCFLEQGVICMGPVTREGCGARCTEANVPCRGCMGPSRRDFEQGAKMVDALAAVLPAGAMMFLDDVIGTGYRFSLPVSVFPAALPKGGEADG